MFILLEKVNSRLTDTISNYDCMGYTDSEQVALQWRNNNLEYRTYKYCPDNKIIVAVK